MAPAAKCGVCTKSVTNTDFGVQCDTCYVWFHSSCVDMSKELYDMIGKNPNINYNCAHCMVNPEQKVTPRCVNISMSWIKKLLPILINLQLRCVQINKP